MLAPPRLYLFSALFALGSIFVPARGRVVLSFPVLA